MEAAIVFLPLLGAMIAGALGKRFGDAMPVVLATALVCVASVLAWILFVQTLFGTGTAYLVPLLTWINLDGFSALWAVRIDALSAVMMIVVTSVSALVHVYAIGYMDEDPHKPRFFAYLSLFTFFMLMLVGADNLLQLFFGWEGVGLASYLLIGFWFHKPSANAAAIKAFVVNRVGDFAFILGIFALYRITGSIAFDEIFARLDAFDGRQLDFFGLQASALELTCFLLFVGAMGKSAQFFLHTWLPDAMEGPTPVSALIHAATMVTAGVFLLARLAPLYELADAVSSFVVFIGAFTALFAASVGIVQNDIKRVIAYSTCSQLGYMFAVAGAGLPEAAIFHLFTHAFFKALLFLGAGAVITAMHHEQDLRNMGGLARKLPFTCAMMVVGTLALTGFPLTAGFYSKDAIIEVLYTRNDVIGDLAFAFLVIAALMTAFYSWRLIFLAFFRPPAAGNHAVDDAREPKLIMRVPLALLAVGALCAGWGFYDAFIGENRMWGSSLGISTRADLMIDAMHHVPTAIKLLPILMMVSGLLMAVLFYLIRPTWPKRIAASQHYLYTFLSEAWFVDRLYDLLFVRTAHRVAGLLFRRGDEQIINRYAIGSLVACVRTTTRWLVRVQSGLIFNYAFAMMLGVLVLLGLGLFGGGS